MDPNIVSMLGQQMPELQKMMQSNPDAMKQMSGFWKFLDNLSESSPEEYNKFIQGQMSEMKEELKKEKDVETKNYTINSSPAFCMKVLVARKLDKKEEEKQQKKDDGIKLFEFNNEAQIKEAFADTSEKGDPLEEPKIYLNVVHHDKVLPPLNKWRDLADQQNDREWLIIPIVFTKPAFRQSLDGL